MAQLCVQVWQDCFFQIFKLSRATTRHCRRTGEPRAAVAGPDSASLLRNAPRGQTYQGHGKGQRKGISSNPPILQYVLQITRTGLSLPSQLQPALVKKLLRQPFNLPKSLLFAIRTHQKAICWSPSPFMGSSLQNTEC